MVELSWTSISFRQHAAWPGSYSKLGAARIEHIHGSAYFSYTCFWGRWRITLSPVQTKLICAHNNRFVTLASGPLLRYNLLALALSDASSVACKSSSTTHGYAFHALSASRSMYAQYGRAASLCYCRAVEVPDHPLSFVSVPGRSCPSLWTPASQCALHCRCWGRIG